MQETAKPYGGGTEIEIQPFTDEQITQFVSAACDIHNHHYLDRIVDIAKGNPRLALMAGRVAVRENTLRSIADVSALYDEYFSSIRRDINGLEDKNLLKTAGIIVFFRVIDRSSAVMPAITSVFNITGEQFWEAAHRLHELEVLDMYEDEIVRVSDQVLATYLFYLAFFKERVISFSVLLEHFFPQFRHRLIDVLNPLLSAFDSKGLIDSMRPHVERVWQALDQAGDDDRLLELVDVFWFLKQTDTLLYLREQIAAMEPQDYQPTASDYKPDASGAEPPILHILSMFRYTEQSNVRIAIGLVCDYLTKRPKELPKVLHLLIEDYGFKHTSNVHHYVVEQTVVDVLWERTKDGQESLFARVFVAIAQVFLRTQFHTHEARKKWTVTIYDFTLPPTEDIFALRQTIWRHVLALYHIPTFAPSVLEILHSYTVAREPAYIAEFSPTEQGIAELERYVGAHEAEP